MFELRSPQPRIKFLSTESETSLNLSRSVISFQTQKNIDQLAGTFSLTLVPRASEDAPVNDSRSLSYIYRNISPMDLISIGMDSDGSIMLGIVDNVYKQRMNVNNQVRRSIIVRGRDFGKLLITDNTMFAPSSDKGYINKLKLKLKELKIIDSGENVNNHPLINLFTENRAPERIDNQGGSIGRTFIGADIDEAIRYVLRSLTSLRVKLTFDGKENVSVHELLKIDISSRDNDQIATQSHNSYTGVIANLLYSLIDRDFYEMFIETIDGQAVFFVRPRPFDRINDKIGSRTLTKNDSFIWDNLKTLVNGEDYHEIKDRNILQTNLGVSDFEAYAMYVHNVRQSLIGAYYEEAGLFWPMIDGFTLKRYGLRRKDTVSNLLPIEIENKKIKDQGDIEKRIREYRDRIFNWNRFNPILESGNIVARGNENYKIGDRINLVDEIAQNGEKGILGYCVGTSHIWNYGSQYITNIQLIRGENQKLLKNFKQLTDKHILRSG